MPDPPLDPNLTVPRAPGLPPLHPLDSPTQSNDPNTSREPSASPSASALDGLPHVPGYDVLGEIARGGMGRVLSARDRTLDREVALKVLLPGESAAAATRRFVGESRITARLPHPAIPPVYALGTLPDGRPFLAMKLVRGRTLADLLRDRPNPAHDLPRWVQVFEPVCQAVGFAHAQGVIHRDLKPSNVMVGAFGEVQVMDWGLAKDLDESAETNADDIGFPSTDDDRTQAGSVLGTPAYMAPEQARGELERVDARADVFALGGILCVILTGRAPFAGADSESSLRFAAAGDVAAAFARLDACGADAELIALAKWCLAPDPAIRPRDGSAVAAAVAAYRASVDDRLRTAEREQAAAAAAARAQDQKRRWQLALGGVLVAVAVGLAVTAWFLDRQSVRRRHLEAERDAAVLRQTVDDERRGQSERERFARNAEAIDSLLGQCAAALRSDDYGRAAAALDQAERRRAEGGGEAFRARFDRCRTDVDMLADLDRIDYLRWSVVRGRLLGLQRAAAEWPGAFRRFGIVPGETPVADAARRIDESLIADRLLAALDQWYARTRSASVLQLLAVADPDRYRCDVRAAWQSGDVGMLRGLAAQPAALDQPARFAVVLGQESALTDARREQVLRGANRRQPNNLHVLMALGDCFPINQANGAAERAGWYRAALAVRPTNAAAWNNLGIALKDKGDVDGAIAAYDESLRIDARNASAHNNRGVARGSRGDTPGAIAGFTEAIRLDADYAAPHYNLGNALYRKGDWPGAVGRYRDAVRLDPNYVEAYFNLGLALAEQDDTKGAAAAFRAAIRLAPNLAPAHHSLGRALYDAGDLPAARSAFLDAIRLDPNDARAHTNLGDIAADSGDLKGAVAEYRIAIKLDPKLAPAHHNLGLALTSQGDIEGAMAAYREAIRFAPGDARTHLHLGNLHAGRGEYVTAAVCARSALDADPNIADAHALLGLALHKMGDVPAARTAYSAAARLNPKKWGTLPTTLPPIPIAPPPRTVIR